MKILLVQTFIQCIEGRYYIHKATGDLLRELSSYGLDVKISGLLVRAKTASNNVIEVDLGQLLILKEHFSGWRRPVVYLFAFIKCFFKINAFDFIYLFSPGHYPLLCGLASILRGRKIGIYLRGSSGAFNLAWKLIYAKSEFGFATGIALSDALKRYTVSNEVTPMIDIPEIINEIKLNESVTNVIFVGSITSEKGIKVLLEAFDSEQILSNAIHLHIVGLGDGELIQRLEVCSNITLHGVISDRSVLFGLLQASDALCLPSYTEGFPRVIYEASYSKCAILTTFVGSIGSMMENQKNCLKLDIGSVSSLIDKLLVIHGDQEFLCDLKRGAREFFDHKVGGDKLTHAEQIIRSLPSSAVFSKND